MNHSAVRLKRTLLYLMRLFVANKQRFCGEDKRIGSITEPAKILTVYGFNGCSNGTEIHWGRVLFEKLV
jgi:hypothetical protein